jgi:hypothetical protein
MPMPNRSRGFSPAEKIAVSSSTPFRGAGGAASSRPNKVLMEVDTPDAERGGPRLMQDG